MKWTLRAITVALTTGARLPWLSLASVLVFQSVIAGVVTFVGACAIALPLLLFCLRIFLPHRCLLQDVHVWRKAHRRGRDHVAVEDVVVAGSYGKTTTKSHV